jgi:Spy/CpxP family protein refolding chaperone
MQRSKQQALMFLLGAVLVGGVLGFSAERVLGRGNPRHWASRTRMYDDLRLSEAQRAQVDSLLDARNCQISAVMKPVKAQVDSIKKAGHQQMLQILTPEQQAALELRRSEMERRDSLEKARRDSLRKQASAGSSTNLCKV